METINAFGAAILKFRTVEPSRHYFPVDSSPQIRDRLISAARTMQARVHTNSTGRRVADKGLTGPACHAPSPSFVPRTHPLFLSVFPGRRNLLEDGSNPNLPFSPRNFRGGGGRVRKGEIILFPGTDYALLRVPCICPIMYFKCDVVNKDHRGARWLFDLR